MAPTIDDLRKRFATKPEEKKPPHAADPTRCVLCAKRIEAHVKGRRCFECMMIGAEEVKREPRETGGRPPPLRAVSALDCEHANEVPGLCPCEAPCYCHGHSCRGAETLAPARKGVHLEARMFIRNEVRQILRHWAGIDAESSKRGISQEVKTLLANLATAARLDPEFTGYRCLEDARASITVKGSTCHVDFVCTNREAEALLDFHNLK